MLLWSLFVELNTELIAKIIKIIQATFDDKSRLIQKKTIGYDKHGNIARVHDYDMLKPSEQGNPILINIITYEYD